MVLFVQMKRLSLIKKHIRWRTLMKQLKQLLKNSFLMNIVYKYRMVRFKH